MQTRTTSGVVRGRPEGALAVFRGIPFAQPPTGRLRFAAPRPATAWDGVREASAFGSPPPQSSILASAPGPADDGWLTLNVWTPAPGPAARLPVMGWIYGGAYKLDSADDPGYDVACLAREGGLVVVTFNYRIGVAGFASPGTTAEPLYEPVQTDWLFRMPTQQLAHAQAAAGGVAYPYELAWRAPAHGGALGACHGLDPPLAFGEPARRVRCPADRPAPVPGRRGDVGPLPVGLGAVRRQRRPWLARLRRGAAPHPYLRPAACGHRLSGGGLRRIGQGHFPSPLSLTS